MHEQRRERQEDASLSQTASNRKVRNSALQARPEENRRDDATLSRVTAWHTVADCGVRDRYSCHLPNGGQTTLPGSGHPTGQLTPATEDMWLAVGQKRPGSGRWRARQVKALCRRETVVQVATWGPKPVPLALFGLARPFIAQTWLEAGHSCLRRTGMPFGATDKFDCNSFVNCHKLPYTQMPAKGTKTIIVLGGT